MEHLARRTLCKTIGPLKLSYLYSTGFVFSVYVIVVVYLINKSRAVMINSRSCDVLDRQVWIGLESSDDEHSWNSVVQLLITEISG